jgi:hypothetical protein
MTLAEIEKQLPNGLHDADLKAFAVDLANGKLILEIDVDYSSAEPPAADLDLHTVKITVTGLCYFKIDPPDLLNGYAVAAASDIDAGDDPVQKFLVDAAVAKRLPQGSFLHWIFLSAWNSIMVIGGMDARITEK